MSDVVDYRQCLRCVMDTSDVDIKFDENGFCNYCTEFIKRSAFVVNESTHSKQTRLMGLTKLVVASRNRKSKYDCIVGVSGGVDSSWSLIHAKKIGLNPLAVHMDNGWNSELAQSNISNLVKILNVDLYTHVVNWEEYKKLMEAFFMSNVIDIELLYDNAMLAVNYQIANKFGIKYILAGTNQATEGLKMPPTWNWFKFDKKNIREIAKLNGIYKFKTFPSIGTFQYVYYEFVKKIKWISFLDFIVYDKNEAIAEMVLNYGYKPYPFKHYESIFTRFYQGYILPNKFGVDKRLVHHSSLVISNQLIREDALLDLKNPPYPSVHDLENDLNYFLKKMGWTREQLDVYIRKPGVSHLNYPSELKLWKFLIKIYKWFH